MDSNRRFFKKYVTLFIKSLAVLLLAQSGLAAPITPSGATAKQALSCVETILNSPDSDSVGEACVESNHPELLACYFGGDQVYIHKRRHLDAIGFFDKGGVNLESRRMRERAKKVELTDTPANSHQSMLGIQITKDGEYLVIFRERSIDMYSLSENPKLILSQGTDGEERIYYDSEKKMVTFALSTFISAYDLKAKDPNKTLIKVPSTNLELIRFLRRPSQIQNIVYMPITDPRDPRPPEEQRLDSARGIFLIERNTGENGKQIIAFDTDQKTIRVISRSKLFNEPRVIPMRNGSEETVTVITLKKLADPLLTPVIGTYPQGVEPESTPKAFQSMVAQRGLLQTVRAVLEEPFLFLDN